MRRFYLAGEFLCAVGSAAGRTAALFFCLSCGTEFEVPSALAQSKHPASPAAPAPFLSSAAPAATPRASENSIQNEKQQIVAEINSTKITKEQLRKALRDYLGTESAYFGPDTSHPVLKQVLTRMVERELILQTAARRNVKAPTEEKIIDQYLEQYVYQTAVISDEEVLASYQANPEAFRTPLEIRLRQIVLRPGAESGRGRMAELAKEMEQIRSQAQLSGADFGYLAKQYSQGNTRARGGDLGFVTKNQLEPELGEAAFALTNGEVSQSIVTDAGVFLFKAEGIRGGELQPFEQVRDKIAKRLLADKKAQALQEHLQKLLSVNRVIVYLH